MRKEHRSYHFHKEAGAEVKIFSFVLFCSVWNGGGIGRGSDDPLWLLYHGNMRRKHTILWARSWADPSLCCCCPDVVECPCCRKPSGGQGQRQLWHCRSLQGEVSCRAQRPRLSLKESLAMKERRWSLLCCHHAVRRLAAAQISLLRECESKWHVIWMLMKIFSCFRLQIPSRKLSSGRHYLPPFLLLSS